MYKPKSRLERRVLMFAGGTIVCLIAAWAIKQNSVQAEVIEWRAGKGSFNVTFNLSNPHEYSTVATVNSQISSRNGRKGILLIGEATAEFELAPHEVVQKTLDVDCIAYGTLTKNTIGIPVETKRTNPPGWIVQVKVIHEEAAH